MSIILFFAVLAVLILSHEFGHFIVAKKSGIRVDEFGFGFPPRLFKFRKGETLYTFNLIPFGGFVKIHGEEGGENEDRRSFASKPIWVRAGVMAAGVIFNLVLAWFLLSVGFMVGMPTSADSVPSGTAIDSVKVMVIQVQKGTPAELAGIKAGDDLVDFDSVESVQNFIAENKGEETNIRYQRGDKIFSVTVVPDANPQKGKGSLGVAMNKVGIVKLLPHQALWEGAKMTYGLLVTVSVSIFYFIIDAIRGLSGFDQVIGPVGLVGATGAAATMGFGYLLGFMAMLSINLAIINLIPFPGLDGGRLVFLLAEKIKGSPVSPKFSSIVHGVGLLLLLILMFAITYQDIVKLI